MPDFNGPFVIVFTYQKSLKIWSLIKKKLFEHFTNFVTIINYRKIKMVSPAKPKTSEASEELIKCHLKYF